MNYHRLWSERCGRSVPMNPKEAAAQMDAFKSASLGETSLLSEQRGTEGCVRVDSLCSNSVRGVYVWGLSPQSLGMGAEATWWITGH